MFQINDNFLSSIGYDVANMDESRKQKYIDEFTKEFTEIISERLIQELDEDEINEFNEIQDDSDKAKNWLSGFKPDYESSEDFNTIKNDLGDEKLAIISYATALWLNDAIPQYGQIIQNELNSYQAHLAELRRVANESITK